MPEFDHPLVPGARRVDDEALRMMRDDQSLLQTVREAVQELRRAFEQGEVDVEYFIDHDSDDLEERIYVAVYTSDSEPLERLRRVRRTWWQRHPAYASAPMGLTVHAA